MKLIKASSIFSILAFGSILIACQSKTFKELAVAQVKETATIETKAEEKSTWQIEWDKTLREAKKEATLYIVTGESPELRETWTKIFKEKFGISTVAIGGQGAALVAKLLTERRAGIFNVDVYIAGSTSMYNDLKPAGALDKWENVLFLPEVIEPEAWYGGNLPWIDNDHTMLPFSLAPSGALFVNTSLVRPEEIKSYQAFLDPKWKGKILLNDPTIAGQGGQWFAQYVRSGILGEDYMKALIGQAPAVLRDNRLQATWLSLGKYPISIAVGLNSFLPFIETGAPVKMLVVAEPDYLSASNANIALIDKRPHPASAKLFANWLLSKEGQLLTQKVRARPSARLDIGSEGVTPEVMRKEGVKYILAEMEESLKTRDFYNEKAKEIFGHLMR